MKPSNFSVWLTIIYIPNKIRDLPVTQPITSILIPHREKISDLNRAFWRMSEKLGKFTENCYSILSGDTRTKLQDITFKELYRLIVGSKTVNKIWETKWNGILRYYTLDIDETEWVQVWNNVHNKLLSFEIQSTIWTMLHLNFYCGHKENCLNMGREFANFVGK